VLRVSPDKAIEKATSFGNSFVSARYPAEDAEAARKRSSSGAGAAAGGVPTKPAQAHGRPQAGATATTTLALAGVSDDPSVLARNSQHADTEDALPLPRHPQASSTAFDYPRAPVAAPASAAAVVLGAPGIAAAMAMQGVADAAAAAAAVAAAGQAPPGLDLSAILSSGSEALPTLIQTMSDALNSLAGRPSDVKLLRALAGQDPKGLSEYKKGAIALLKVADVFEARGLVGKLG